MRYVFVALNVMAVATIAEALDSAEARGEVYGLSLLCLASVFYGASLVALITVVSKESRR